jgi:ADP-ribose pyrophosphatase
MFPGDEESMNTAHIVSRNETSISPWVRLVSKEVQFGPNQKTEVYHCLAQADYVVIFACTKSGLIPLIRQYRPAVEAYTWELPAGLRDDGENPEDTCRRELFEETGLKPDAISYLGSYYPDTARLENRSHAFFVATQDPDPKFVSHEAGLSVEFVDLKTAQQYISSGKFGNQSHIGLFALASIKGLIS